jgi:hypothetical protein
MSGMTLYEVTKEGMELEEILTANDGELTPDLEQRLDTFLKAGKDKINAAACVVRGLELTSDACLAEAKRLNERASSILNERDRLKARILAAVDGAFDGKVKTAMFTVWGQSSAPTTGFEVAPDADLVALQVQCPDLVRTKYELDKTALKNRNSLGLAIPKAITVVENTGTRYLRIK